jgi:hypothetical protein
MKTNNPIANYKIPATYHLGSAGCGCAGDPPNYPSYFIKPIYTSHGNSPAYNRPQYYLNNTGFYSIEQANKLWGKGRFEKLPLDHPRVRAWIEDKYRHHQHCYYHTSEMEYGKRKVIIYPVPDYKLKTFKDDERFSDAWREIEKASIEQYNKEIIEQTKEIAIPENHCAVVLIRKFYPEYEPELNLIENPPKHTGNWWTIGDKPTPEECKGQYGDKHPVNGTWCQWCGWHE